MGTQDTQKTQRRRQALGAQIAQLRQRAGMPTQKDLERASGVSVRTISLIESGRKVPRVGTMRKLETALQLPPGATDDYLDGTIGKLEPEGRGGAPDIYRRVVDRDDDFEVQIMDLAARPLEERWSVIFAHRERQRGRSGPTESGSSLGQTG